MEELAQSPDTPAGKLATERFTAAALDSDLYPDGTVFIPADAPDFPAMMAENAAEGRPLAIIYPDGNEILVTPVQGLFAVLVAAFVRGLIARRRSKAATVSSADGAEVIRLPEKYRVELRHPAAAA